MLKNTILTSMLLGVFTCVNAFYIIPIKIKSANTVVVSKHGGDFKDIVLALASITDANKSNPYLIKIAEGEYEISSPLQMKEYVDIVGSGTNKTILSRETGGSTNSLAAVINGSSNSTLSHFSIVNSGFNSAIQTGVYCDAKSSFILQDINITLTSDTEHHHYGIDSHNCNMAIFNSSIYISHGLAVYGVKNDGSIINILDTEIRVSTTLDFIAAIGSSTGSYFVSNSTFTSDNGASTTLSLANGSRLTAHGSDFNGTITYSTSMKCYDCRLSGFLLDEGCHIP